MNRSIKNFTIINTSRKNYNYSKIQINSIIKIFKYNILKIHYLKIDKLKLSSVINLLHTFMYFIKVFIIFR